METIDRQAHNDAAQENGHYHEDVKKMNTLPETRSTAIDYNDDKVVATIKQTVAAGATDAELSMFINFCKSTGLNPFKREIWFIKTKGYTKNDGTFVEGKVQMMVGIQGFYAIANSSPQYDGMEEVTYEKDKDGYIISATARVWRKNRRFPSVGTALWSEYAPEPNKSGKPGIWETKPHMMIGKVAESIALRKAFPSELNGLYTQEEMPSDYAPSLPAPQRAIPIQQPVIHEIVDLKTGEITNTKEAADTFGTDDLATTKKTLLQKMKDAVDGEDLMHIGAHIITTKCSINGLTVSEAYRTNEEKLKENLLKFNALDRTAIDGYLKAMKSLEDAIQDPYNV